MQRRWLEAQHRHNLKGKKQNKIAKTSFNRKCIIIIFFFFFIFGANRANPKYSAIQWHKAKSVWHVFSKSSFA